MEVEPLAPPGHHIPLLEQAEALLVQHLTGLRQFAAPEVNLQPLINTILVGQRQRQLEQAMAHLDRELKETTSVAMWPSMENFARLLRYSGMQEENELAPLWTILAKSPCKDCLDIFEGKVANEFLVLGAIYEQFAPSVFLLTQVTSLKWGMPWQCFLIH